eukprot:9152899-Heterocapsa_arctica.AAC.1
MEAGRRNGDDSAATQGACNGADTYSPPASPASVSPTQARAAMRAMGIDGDGILGDPETAKRKLDELAVIAAKGPRHGTPGGRPPAKQQRN